MTLSQHDKKKKMETEVKRNVKRKTEKEKFVMCLYSKTIVSISGLMRCARQFPRLRIIEFAKYVLRFLDSSTSTRRAPHTTPANHLVDAFFSLFVFHVFNNFPPALTLCLSLRTLSTVKAIIELSK